MAAIATHFDQPLGASHALARQVYVMGELERRCLGDCRPASLSDATQAISSCRRSRSCRSPKHLNPKLGMLLAKISHVQGLRLGHRFLDIGMTRRAVLTLKVLVL